MRIAGLVLAAGEGRRFGRPKALVEVGGQRLADRAVRALAEGGCAPVFVVDGASPLEVPGATTVHNADWATGMGSSLRVGLAALAALEPALAGVVVTVVDQPGSGPDVVRRLVEAHADGADLAVATYAGRPGNPALLGRSHWAGVEARAEGDVGARAYLRAHPDLVTAVECGDVGDPADLDTPADLQHVDRSVGDRGTGPPDDQ